MGLEVLDDVLHVLDRAGVTGVGSNGSGPSAVLEIRRGTALRRCEVRVPQPICDSMLSCEGLAAGPVDVEIEGIGSPAVVHGDHPPREPDRAS